MQRGFMILVATCVLSGLWGQVASAQVVDEQRRREAFKYYRAGEEFMYAEAWEKAIGEFTLAAKFDPLLTLAHYGRGRAHMQLKNYSAAIRAFLDCREAFRTLFALRETDRLKADRLRQDQAQELRNSLDLLDSERIRDANRIVAHQMEARIRELERDLFREPPAQFQVPAEVSLALGSAYFRSGSMEAAEREYRAAIGANRKLGEAHNNLAIVLMMTGRLTEAEKELKLAEKAGFRVNPLFQDDLASRIYLLPGVSNSGQVGAANPSVSGGTGLENQYIVDGVSITNTGYGAVGSYSIVFGSLGTGLPYDWMKEIQVKSGGFEAEYGQTTGGVINVITKSGSNVFSGTAYSYFRPKTLEADWKQMTQVNGKVNTTAFETNDVGLQVGGPIVRDRVFFTAGVNPLWETRTFIAPEKFPLRSLGEQSRKRRIINYSAKGTFQLWNNHRLDASFYGDPAHGEMGPQRSAELKKTNTAGFSEIDYGGHQQVVKWDGVFGPRWLATASFGRSRNLIEETPSVNEWLVRNRTVTPNIFSGGIGFYEVGNDGENRQYQAKSTNILPGGHELRYGALFEDIRYDNVIQRTGPSVTLLDGRRTVTGVQVDILPDPVFGRVYRAVRGNLGNVRETEQQYLSVFVQDAWQISGRLTVKPGLRYEQQKLVGNLAEFQWDGNWGPRIGATYDPTGQGRSKVFGNWGRFYAKIPNDLAARALSRDEGLTRADFFDAGLTRPIPNGTLAAGTTQHLVYAGLEPSVIDPNSKSTYLDEAVVGVEHELARNLTGSIRYINRRMPRVLEDVGTAPMVAYFTGILSSVEYFITNPGPRTPVTDDPTRTVSFEKPVHEYDAIEVSLDKRFSDNWSLVGSYRWSRLFGNFEGFFRNDNGQSDPAITSLFDFPTNDPTYTSIGVPQFGFRGDIRYLGALGAGPLPTDRPHQVKLSGNYIFDMGLNLGASIQLGSGRPLTPMAANPDYQNAGEIPEAPRGSGIQAADGFKKRTPFETDFDFHADYTMNLGDQRVVLFADVFNLFNIRRVRDYLQDTELVFTARHPDFGKVDEYQRPFSTRLGVRFNW